MTIPIVNPEQRLAEPHGARILIVGSFGIGKTSQLRTLNPATTLFVDIENGALAVIDVPVPHARPQTWPEIRDLIVRIAGPNRSFQPQEPYSQSHFDMCGGYLPGIESGQVHTVFLDTITAATRLCLRWAAAQPEAFSERTGKPDTARRLWTFRARVSARAAPPAERAGTQHHPGRRARDRDRRLRPHRAPPAGGRTARSARDRAASSTL